MEYTKPPLTYRQQVDLLQSRGLGIDDRNYAVRLLKRISYYRLSAYGLPFQSQKDRYDGSTKIEDIEKLYNFDRELRNLYLTTVSRIEIPLRTRIVYHLAHQYGPFGYLDEGNFLKPKDSNHSGDNSSKRKGFKHSDWLSHVMREIERSEEIFIKHFQQKYGEDSPGLPIWMLTEVMTFGSLLSLFSGLKNNDKSEISKELGVHWQFLNSWIRCLVSARNICAHHGRFWNRILGIRPMIPKKMEKWHTPFSIENNKVFSVFTITNYLLKILSSGYDLKGKIIELFDKYPSIDTNKMGFVAGWQSHELWK